MSAAFGDLETLRSSPVVVLLVTTVALLVAVILVGPFMISRTSAIAMTVLGVASGLTYAIVARVLMQRQEQART